MLRHPTWRSLLVAAAAPGPPNNGRYRGPPSPRRREVNMAQVKLNPVLEGMHGQIGDLVFKQYQDQTVVSRKPETVTQPNSPAQLAVRDQFRLAALYGKTVLADGRRHFEFLDGLARGIQARLRLAQRSRSLRLILQALFAVLSTIAFWAI